jgi:hypothetical protein
VTKKLREAEGLSAGEHKSEDFFHPGACFILFDFSHLHFTFHFHPVFIFFFLCGARLFSQPRIPGEEETKTQALYFKKTTLSVTSQNRLHLLLRLLRRVLRLGLWGLDRNAAVANTALRAKLAAA